MALETHVFSVKRTVFTRFGPTGLATGVIRRFHMQELDCNVTPRHQIDDTLHKRHADVTKPGKKLAETPSTSGCRRAALALGLH